MLMYFIDWYFYQDPAHSHFHQASKCCVSSMNIRKHQFYYINIHHKNCQVGVRNLSTMMALPSPSYARYIMSTCNTI